MNKVFGRDKIIERIWKLLLEFSILFTAERRVGKTTILNELKNNPKKGYRVIYSDLEKIDSPLEFINDVLNKTEPFISNKDKVTGWFFKLWEKFEGVEIAGRIKIPKQKEKDWKELLQIAIKRSAKIRMIPSCFYGMSCHICYKKLMQLRLQTVQSKIAACNLWIYCAR